MNYFGRQLVAREVELERIRRSTPRLGTDRGNNYASAAAKSATKNLPNHLQRLKAKQIEHKNANAKKDVSNTPKADIQSQVKYFVYTYVCVITRRIPVILFSDLFCMHNRKVRVFHLSMY